MQRHERVIFRLIRCPECKFQLCWVNPRKPSYCPECGKSILTRVGECTIFSDPDAVITVKEV